MSSRTIRIVADEADLARTAAGEFCRLAEEAIRARGWFRIALAGGSTPRRLYRLLAGEEDRSFRERVPWVRTQFFFGDERHAPPDHPESNYRMVRETLLGGAPVPEGNLLRVRSELGAGEAARDYERILRESFGMKEGGIPRFDLVLLGMGTDGHTASLFPGNAVLQERERLVAAPWIEEIGASRITLTPPVINNAACVLFMVVGREKAEMLKRVLEGPLDPGRYPAQAIRPESGTLVWLVDRAAARLLERAGRSADPRALTEETRGEDPDGFEI